MGKRNEILILLLTDIITLCLAWVAYYLIRVESGWITLSIQPDLVVPMVFVYLFWVLVFFMVGLYRPWSAASRFDELALLFKTISLGCLFLFFAVFVDDQGTSVAASSRLLIAVYWGVLLVAVSVGRLAIRSIQRRMLIAGIGTRRTLLVGSNDKALALYNEVTKYPALGFRVVGSVTTLSGELTQINPEVPVLGDLDALHDLITEKNIEEILIALDSSDHSLLLDIMAKSNSHNVGMKIMPDLYDIISGQARTNAIYGFPLIEISPQLMTPWEESLKRILDVGVSFVVLILGLPAWGLIAATVKLESPGPVLYKQERVGKDGERFNMIKFRSMREDAEKAGPQWAHKKDPRVTRVGKWLRKLHLDEVPQFINVLNGHMSLVGPRPERPVFVESLSKEIPLYTRRLKVRPGITGWAQVKHRYDETIDDVRKKVQYDLYYIENMSLRMDMKILFNTALHMLLGRGR